MQIQNKYIQKFILLVLFTIIGYVITAQPKNSTTEINTITRELKKFCLNPDVKNASIGFCVIDISTGIILSRYNPDMALVPASIQKLITTATAIEIFGDDYQFKTTIEHDGYIDKKRKILFGNIYIKGGGDPVLGSKRFENKYYNPDFVKVWAQKIKQAGIDSIEGAIIGDAQVYNTGIPSTWTWEDIGNSFGAGPSGLSIYDNVFEITIQSDSKNNQPAKIIDIRPRIPGIYINNEVKTSVIDGNQLGIFGAPYENTRIIKGTLTPGKQTRTTKGSIPDPAYFAATELERNLFYLGVIPTKSSTTIRIEGKFGNWEEKKTSKITETISPELKDIIRTTNNYSVNLYAENLLCHLGYIKRSTGNAETGIRVVTEYWKSKGMDTNGLYLMDGCGLSRYNAITARQMVFLLRYMNVLGNNYTAFHESLPIAGQSGTLSYFCRGTLAEGRVHAKSGSMSRVKAYAGYATTLSGKQLAFCLMVNNFNCESSVIQKKMESLMTAIVQYK